MLKHIVLFTFKPTSTAEQVSEIVNSFKDLEHLVPEILEFEWGNNVSHEKHHQGFTHCFTISFESLETLATYQINKHHLEFQKVIQPHMEKVFVVDYYV